MPQIALKALDYLKVNLLNFSLKLNRITSKKNPPCLNALKWKYLAPIHKLLNFLYLVDFQNGVRFVNNSSLGLSQPTEHPTWATVLGKCPQTTESATFVTCLTQLFLLFDNLRKKKWMTHVSLGSNSCLNHFGRQNSKVGSETHPPFSPPPSPPNRYTYPINLLCLILGRTVNMMG